MKIFKTKMALNSKSPVSKAFTPPNPPQRGGLLRGEYYYYFLKISPKGGDLEGVSLFCFRFFRLWQQRFARQFQFALLVDIQQFNTYFVAYVKDTVHGFETFVVYL